MIRIAVGCDDAGYEMKHCLLQHLEAQGFSPADFGTAAGEVIDYPITAEKVAQAVSQGEYDRGILICGTGIGMSIVANKVAGVRAALCHDTYSAERARKSNDAQILTFGARVIGIELAKKIVDTWLSCDFAGGGSAPKLEKIKRIDQDHRKN